MSEHVWRHGPRSRLTTARVGRIRYRFWVRVHGVRFIQLPTAMGDMVTAILDDTCGTLIQLMGPA